MSFYRRILKNILNNESSNIEDILINTRALTVLYIMKIHNLLDKNDVKCGVIEISESYIFDMVHIEKPTNNDIYDLLLYLDYENELDNYMSLNNKLIPKYDSFYDDINEKIGLKKINQKNINIDKVCPICHMIPYYDFDEKCDVCRNCTLK